MEKIEINGNRPIEILDGLKSIEVLKEYSALDSTATKFEVVFNTPEPTFEVSMRVECIQERDGFTKGMVYKAVSKYKYGNEVRFTFTGDDGDLRYFNLEDTTKYFTPYTKPDNGDYYIIEEGMVKRSFWSDSEEDYDIWNLGLAFKTREQAEFARERLSKLF